MQKLYMTPTGVKILGVSPTGVQKLGMTGVKNLGVSNRCAKKGKTGVKNLGVSGRCTKIEHDRCAKTVHDTDRCTNIGCVTDRYAKIGHDRC